MRNCLGPQVDRPCFGNQRCSGVPLAAHAQPKHKAEKSQHGDGVDSPDPSEHTEYVRMLSISALVRPMRSAINPNNTPPMPEASRVKAPSHPAIGLGMMPKSRHHVSRWTVAIQHHVKGIQGPAQRRRNQRALLRRSSLGKSRKCSGSHGRGDSSSFSCNPERERGNPTEPERIERTDAITAMLH